MAEVKIVFIHNGQNETIECKKNEYMLYIYKRYVMKIQGDLKKLFFLCNGSLINLEVKLEQILQKDQTTINMIVLDLDNDEDNKINLKQSKDIICPI